MFRQRLKNGLRVLGGSESQLQRYESSECNRGVPGLCVHFSRKGEGQLQRHRDGQRGCEDLSCVGVWGQDETLLQHRWDRQHGCEDPSRISVRGQDQGQLRCNRARERHQGMPGLCLSGQGQSELRRHPTGEC